MKEKASNKKETTSLIQKDLKIDVNGLMNPSISQFYNHVINGGHIKYSTDILLNDTTTKTLTGNKGSVELHYSFGKNFEPTIKRFKFGAMATLNFKMNLVELIKIEDVKLIDNSQESTSNP
jgi:hypothetical protein